MQRLVLTHDLLQRKVLKDARSSRQPELVPGIATQIDQPRKRVRHRLALARRHDDAVRPDHPAAVTDVGGDAWHPARHRLAQNVGEAFAPGRRQRGDIEAGDPLRHVVALAEQRYLRADPALAHQGA